jgi:hypothetical protein
MAETIKTNEAATGNPADYSATKAPENREHVESTARASSPAGRPGGAHGPPAEVGMSGLYRTDRPSMSADAEKGESEMP